MKNKNTNNPTGTVAKKRNPLLIFVCVTVAAVLVFGAVLGIVSAVLSAGAVIEYNGVRIDEKTASYLVSVYKNSYIAAKKADGVTNASDKESFWSSKNEEGVTYAEDFERSAAKYLSEIAVSAYLFERNGSMNAEMKKSVKASAAEVPEFYYKTEGFEHLFEEDAAKMGYDYDAFEDAAILLYKASRAKSLIYGENGSGVSVLTDVCAEYLAAAYSRVELVFIRTETTYRQDGDGKLQLYKLNEEERAARAAEIKELRQLIENYKNGVISDKVITHETIRTIAANYIGDQSADRVSDGYYLSPTSEYTASIMSSAELAPAIEEALKLELDESGVAYSSVTLTFTDKLGDEETVECFMYKTAAEDGAYAKSALSDFFTDFYSDAADFAYAKEVNERLSSVNVKDKFYEMNVALIPKNDIHVIRQL